MDAVAIRCCSFRKERHGESLAQDEGNIFDFRLQARRLPSLHKKAAAESCQSTNDRCVFQLNRGYKNSRNERGENENVDIRKMVCDDEENIALLEQAFAMFYLHVNSEQYEHKPGE